ncbi:MAG: methyltransferase domain-containing protein [Planctomycetaceae bacterium]|nr:methyltransferase domain-containing protein [Planctomycetaceae bacterium]
MIASLSNAELLLEPFSPQVPTEEVVEALNRWYHKSEAVTYDHEHAEIKNQLPPIWKQMISCVREQFGKRRWRILDFGCGTGFEAEQLLNQLEPDGIAELWCYDLSPEMLECCRNRISPRYPAAHFITSLDALPKDEGHFNILTTNSVLHHLPAPQQTLRDLRRSLTRDAFWLAGHEPSSRFYKNASCSSSYDRFVRQYRRQRWLSPSAYLGFISRKVGLHQTPSQAAASAAFAAGMLKHEPSPKVVSRIVDLHVAHSREEAIAGRGFDLEQMQTQLANQWRLHWTQSYSFMGSFYEGNLPERWQQEATRLKHHFPQDGANFCAVWQSTSNKMT